MIKKINLTNEGNNAYILTITTDDGGEQGFWDVTLTKDELLDLAEFINKKFKR